MIFLTVGVQLPFDRLVRAVDTWAERQGRTDVVAQIGETSYRPRRMSFTATMSSHAFRDHVQRAEVVVAHAGMGSIITALELGKPIIVLPRRATLNEHRNDHQLATAQRLAEKSSVQVAATEHDVATMLDRLGAIDAGAIIPPDASDTLVAAVAGQIAGSQVKGSWMTWLRRP